MSLLDTHLGSHLGHLADHLHQRDRRGRAGSAAGPQVGMVVAARRAGHGSELGTELTVRRGEGREVVMAPAVACADELARLRGALRRVVSVRIECSGGLWHAWVRGIGHRTPREIPVRLCTALALTERGVPTALAGVPAGPAGPAGAA